jgi:tetratricopeptide (TPR) repeat protein
MAARYLILKWCGLILLALVWDCRSAVGATALPEPVQPAPEIMRLAIHQALNVQFDAAIETATQLQDEEKPTFGSHLLRGIIAYLQTRWQSRQSPNAYEVGHKALSTVLEAGPKYLSTSEPEAWFQTLLGLAAVFDALMQLPDAPWQSAQLMARGRTWLQNARIADTATPDAHLGLGLAALAATHLPGPLQLVLGQTGNAGNTSQAIHHLQRAAETGQFSQDLARTFLARLYEEEKRYREAIELAQALRETFPDNGYYRLLIGRSQCADSRFADCAATLEQLDAQLQVLPLVLARRDDRFDLYYTWAGALYERGRDDQAFNAFRQAINQDPQADKDDTLWAKFHLAELYQRRGQRKTARQLYQTLLRERNVENLHDQVRRRLQTMR